jgi:4-hydroxy-tetrahydrodipicolinate synthase
MKRVEQALEVPIKRSYSENVLPVHGVFAAMTLPRGDGGQLELDVFARHLQFVQAAGVQGFVLNGATGEYCLTSVEELGRMLGCAREVVGPGVKLLAGVGGASFSQVIARVEAAQAGGADALLLPMPYFFPYEQQDLIAFSKQVAQHAELPVLLYNLPEFTTPIEPVTTLQLLQETGVAGVKDSSGGLETLRLLTQSFQDANRVIGNDAALHASLLEGLCDGVVSGVASVLPELMLAFYRAAKAAPLSGTTLELKSNLEAVLDWLGRFPVPWGLKMIAAERGFLTAEFGLPLSPQREAEGRGFARWFQAHRGMLLAVSSLDAKVSASL